jgi:hypothetical protein
MTATIYNGRGAPDAARTVSFDLPDGDYSGLALAIDLLGNRVAAGIGGDGRCTAIIPEEALRAIPCGTHTATLLLRGPDGREGVFATVSVRVSDIPGEASAYADVAALEPPGAVTAGALAEALAAIDAPASGATQRTLRETLSALVAALKGLGGGVAAALLLSGCGVAFADTGAWEDVPPGTRVDTNALIVSSESDPIFVEWVDANTNRYGYVSHVEEAETARFADYAEQAGSADEAQTAGTATYADSSAFATNAADAQHAWNAETASTLLVGLTARDGEFFTGRDAAVAQAATNYTDEATALSPIYSQTPTFSEWTFSDVLPEGAIAGQPVFYGNAGGWIVPLDGSIVNAVEVFVAGSSTDTSIHFDSVVDGDRIVFTATRTRTDIAGYRLGPSDGPNADKLLQPHGDYATSAGVTNIVRDLSLGGIWDEQIQVWWTPRMRNGSLTYEATTNVNLNAED